MYGISLCALGSLLKSYYREGVISDVAAQSKTIIN